MEIVLLLLLIANLVGLFLIWQRQDKQEVILLPLKESTPYLPKVPRTCPSNLLPSMVGCTVACAVDVATALAK